MISIIIRTKNEEQWIAHCLRMVYDQSIKDIEVVIVDNHSTDHTLDLARKFPVKIVEIEKYYPGQALNFGIKASQGDHFVCLSAHCIPKHNQWLENMYRNFAEDDKIAGVYGRQIPFKYSSDVDKRDLFITFGLDRRVQIKDTFFHNANSMIPRKLWEEVPFDSEVTNIEDRVWAQEIIKRGYKIVYEPEAEVFHCHGIHHSNEKKRSEQTVKIMENLHVDLKGDIPSTFKPEQINAVAFVPLIGEVTSINGVNLLERTVNQIKSCPFIKDAVVISENNDVLSFAQSLGAKTIFRGADQIGKGKDLESSLSFALEQYEKDNPITDAVVFVNYLFPFRPEKFFDDLVEQYCYTGSDSTMASLKNYRVLWLYSEEEGYQAMGENFKPRDEKMPVYEGLVGLGCITSSRYIRQGHLLGKEVELLDIKEPKYSIKADDYPSEILQFLFDQEDNKNIKLTANS